MSEKQPEPTIEELSNCHKAKVRVAGETTNYYVCELCQEPCDLWQEDEPNLDEQIDKIIEMLWDFSPFQDEDSRIERVHKELKALIANQVEQARGCVDCKKLRCDNCERLWQT